MLNPVSKYVCRERLRINVLVSFKVLHAKKTSCSKNVSHGAPLHCYSFSRMIFTRILCVHACVHVQYKPMRCAVPSRAELQMASYLVASHRECSVAGFVVTV